MSRFPDSPISRLSTSIVLTLLVGLAGCATSINKVLADPSRYRDHEVKIKGAVHDSFSLASRGVYRVENEEKQSLWVVSDHGVPRTGAHVTVKGTVREGFNIGPLAERLPRDIGFGLVLVEHEHHAD